MPQEVESVLPQFAAVLPTRERRGQLKIPPVSRPQLGIVLKVGLLSKGEALSSRMPERWARLHFVREDGVGEYLPAMWPLDEYREQKVLLRDVAHLRLTRDLGSLALGWETSSIKTCARFPKGREQDSSESLPKGGSLLQYLEGREVPPSAGRAALEQLSATSRVVRSPVQEGGHLEHLEQGAQPEQFGGSQGHTDSEEAGASRDASDLASRRKGIKLGPRPRDKATADYYRAIHGSARSRFQPDVHRQLAPLEAPRPGAGTPSEAETPQDPLPETEGSPAEARPLTEEKVVEQFPSSQTFSGGPQSSGGVQKQGTQYPFEGYLAPLEITQQPEIQGCNFPIANERQERQKQVLGSGAREPTASRSNQLVLLPTAPPRDEVKASTPTHVPETLAIRPLTTSNVDPVHWPNAHHEAAEARLGRPIVRYTNRHDQNILPRRASQVRRGPNDIVEYLPCGHTRGTYRDEKYCNERVIKKTPYCGHEANVECSNPMKRWKCRAICGQHLPCLHYCKRACFQCLDEIKIDGTPVWNHNPCDTCLDIREAEERRMKLEEDKRAKNAAGIADRAQGPE
ncbi:hypothetical protein TWF281_003815 [Arthrobotrys megalospora]